MRISDWSSDVCSSDLVLAELVRSDRPASDLLHQFDPVPQLLKNVRFAGGKPLDDAQVQAAIAEGEAALAGRGRLVIRASGPEPVIRVLAEGAAAAQVETLVDRICDAVRVAAASCITPPFALRLSKGRSFFQRGRQAGALSASDRRPQK